MKRRSVRRAFAWREASAECRRAEEYWTSLRTGVLREVLPELSEREIRHLRHTVFRINAFMCLYARLRGLAHNTELGTVCGAITHLLDYAYDSHRLEGESLLETELTVLEGRRALSPSPLQTALHQLGLRAWKLVPEPKAIGAQIGLVLSVQRRSMAQHGEHQETRGHLSQQALRELTEEKGHRALCLYCSAVNPDFRPVEANRLKSFGMYLQIMDDLEDFYVDKAEGRQSPVAGILSGMCTATRLFRIAMQDLLALYRTIPNCRYRMFASWLVVYHTLMMASLVIREMSRKLPWRVQCGIDKGEERLLRRFPILYIAPISHTNPLTNPNGS